MKLIPWISTESVFFSKQIRNFIWMFISQIRMYCFSFMTKINLFHNFPQKLLSRIMPMFVRPSARPSVCLFICKCRILWSPRSRWVLGYKFLFLQFLQFHSFLSFLMPFTVISFKYSLIFYFHWEFFEWKSELNFVCGYFALHKNNAQLQRETWCIRKTSTRTPW